jgi:hypothetical protein
MEGEMPTGDDATGWDFLALLWWWNLCLLPVVLIATGALVFTRQFLRGSQSTTDARRDGVRILRLIALIHFGLAIRAAIALVQELLTFREMGVAESFANFILAVLGVLVNPALGLGFWLRRPAAWWFGVAWYAFLSVIQVMVIRWLLDYSGPFDPIWWPYHAAGKVLPFFLLVVMFLPRTRRAFIKKARPDAALIETVPIESPIPVERPSAVRWSLFSVLTLWFLMIVLSNAVVESAEWIDRLVWPPA